MNRKQISNAIAYTVLGLIVINFATSIMVNNAINQQIKEQVKK